MYVLQTSLILWVVLPQYVVYNLPGSHRVDRRNPKYYYVERDYSREREEGEQVPYDAYPPARWVSL